MPTTPPPPMRIRARDGVGANAVVVAVHEDGTELTVDANGPAELLLDLLDDADTLGDLRASHRYVKDSLGEEQYATLRTWGLTQVEYAALGAHIIDVCTGAVFELGDHLDSVNALLERSPELEAAIARAIPKPGPSNEGLEELVTGGDGVGFGDGRDPSGV